MWNLWRSNGYNTKYLISRPIFYFRSTVCLVNSIYLYKNHFHSKDESEYDSEASSVEDNGETDNTEGKNLIIL